MMRLSLVVALASLAMWSCGSRHGHNPDGIACFYAADTIWVNEQLAGMSREEKIGQLLLIETDTISTDTVKFIVDEFQPGGLVLETDSIAKQTWLTSVAQKRSTVPLLIMCDEENGYPNFLHDAPMFPSKAALEAVRDTALLVQFAATSAEHGGALGFNIMPTPLISAARPDLAIAALDSMKSRRLITGCTMPSDSISIDRLDTVIRSGLPMLLVHADQPFDRPAQFDGLVVAECSRSHDVKAQVGRALQSGVDVIRASANIRDVVGALDALSAPELDRRVRKVLRAKAWCRLDQPSLDGHNVTDQINTPQARLLARQLFEASVTLVKNERNIVPISSIVGNKMLMASVGSECMPFREQHSRYANYSGMALSGHADNYESLASAAKGSHTVIVVIDSLEPDAQSRLAATLKEIHKGSRVIAVNLMPVALDSIAAASHAFIQVYGSSPTEQELAAQLIFGGVSAPGSLPFPVANAAFGDGIKNTPITRLGYGLPEEVGIDPMQLAKVDTIIREAIGNAATPGSQVFVAIKGKVILNKTYGYHNYSRSRPVRWNDMYDIASVTKVAATTIAVMKLLDQGKVSLDDRLEKYFKDTHIDYTRIKADTTVLIDTINTHHVDNLAAEIKGRDTIHLNDSLIETRLTRISKLTPKLNIFKARLRDLLLHKSGIAPSIPIIDFLRYRDSLHGLFNRFYCNTMDADFCVRVADNLYMRADFLDTLWSLTKQMRVYGGEPVFQYSDANMVIAQRVADSASGITIDEFMRTSFYEPMGLRFTSYLPLNRFKRDQIVPTEVDRYWRNQTLQGDVHDPTAAILGGVSGNAGLFSSASDLGVLFQMLLNGGTYGGRRYLSSAVVRLFTTRQPGSHRGLGFDMQAYKAICAKSASPRTFGHTGFTGTCVWVDPDKEMVFVFLSNRVHPSAKNWRLNSMQVRQRVHQAVYDALEAGFGESVKRIEA